MSNIKPLGRQILIQEPPRRKASDAGLTIPDIALHPEREWVYTVLAIGPDVDRDLHPGDRVVLDQFRLNAKAEAGVGLWLVSQDSVALIIPAVDKPVGGVA